MEIAAAVMISCCLLMAAWYVTGACLTPVRAGDGVQIKLLIGVSGSAPELEQAVSGLLWLIDNGTIPGEIVICDLGMDESARTAARALAGDSGRVHFGSCDTYGTG